MRFLFAVLLAMFLYIAVAVPAHADGSSPAVCDGLISSKRTGGLRVPSGATCVVQQQSVVSGAVKVRTDGILKVEGSRVTGDLSIDRGGKAVFTSSKIQGNLTAARATVQLSHSKFWGRLTLVEGGSLTVSNSKVYGDLSLAEGGKVKLVSTEIQGKLAAVKAKIQLKQTEIWGRVTLAGGGSLRAFKADLLKGISGSGAGLRVLLDTSQLRGNVRFNSGRSIEIRTSKAEKNVLIGRGMIPARNGLPLKLINSQVAGDVKVRSGRLLRLDASKIRGSLDLGKLGLTVTQSKIYGRLDIAPGGSARLVKSAVEGSLKATRARAKLLHSSVAGKVRFHKGGSLTARVAKIGGDLFAAGSGFKAAITGSNMKRGVTVKSGRSVEIKRSRVRRNIDLSRIRGAVAVGMSTIEGSVKIQSSPATTAGIRIFRNSINGNLSCFSNRRSPSGGRNGVRRKKKGQCSKL